MKECYILKRICNQNRTSVREYLIEGLDVLVHEYTIPYGKIYDLRYKLIKNKLSKGGIVFDENYISNKKLISRIFPYFIDYIINVYGFRKDTLEIGLVIHEFSDNIKNLILILSKKVRFLVIYGYEYKTYLSEIMETTGLCVSYSPCKKAKEKIVIYADDDVIVDVFGKQYYDVEIVYSFAKNINDNALFDKIIHEFATENDIKNLFNSGYVKKMVLKSK